ncbi:glutathione S-transferase [Parvibaculum sp.]|jgi:glutathione S-transferase|uniref:glutathione S-transferase family protein n=1 Tax=Parvibaculum sp. TaxID=2024848 RepID=UPI000C4440E9|nr:glutathione S-transferase [Parvibaculum sp.]MAM95421.1 glutathione S-transferase [Parvibaculum sp.]|tara:strand:- start:2474 stop:3109 length:636 start_codon:yes stop_codon:yes gene_type:complete
MAVTLYDFTAAPSPRRARILLAEKGIAHETVQVDLTKAEQLSEAYRKINPACTVPALKLEDGTILTENIGIAAWAEEISSQPRLLGATPVEKGLVFSWNARIEFEGFMPIAEILRNTSKGMAGRALPGPIDLPQIPELAARGSQRLTHFFDMLNERLQGRDYIAIDSFSLADITALVCIDFAKWVKHEPKPEHTDLLRWYATVSARPSAKA